MAFQHTLLQAVRHRDVGDTTIEAVHASMGSEQIAALHVLGGPCKQQVTEAESRDKHVRLANLSGLQLHPLETVAGVIHFDSLTGRKLPRRDLGLSVFRELPVELLPEIAVRGQLLGFPFPDKLQRMTQTQIMNDRWPVQLQHPQRVCG